MVCFTERDKITILLRSATSHQHRDIKLQWDADEAIQILRFLRIIWKKFGLPWDVQEAIRFVVANNKLHPPTGVKVNKVLTMSEIFPQFFDTLVIFVVQNKIN